MDAPYIWFLKQVSVRDGKSYLKKCFKESMKLIEEHASSFEVREKYVHDPFFIEGNSIHLRKLVEKIIQSISFNLNFLPERISMICKKLHLISERTIAGNGFVALSSFFFLRFICPAIVYSDKLLSMRSVSTEMRRVFILVSKIVQKLANDASRLSVSAEEQSNKSVNSRTFDNLSGEDFGEVMEILGEQYHTSVKQVNEILSKLVQLDSEELNSVTESSRVSNSSIEEASSDNEDSISENIAILPSTSTTPQFKKAENKKKLRSSAEFSCKISDDLQNNKTVFVSESEPQVFKEAIVREGKKEREEREDVEPLKDSKIKNLPSPKNKGNSNTPLKSSADDNLKYNEALEFLWKRVSENKERIAVYFILKCSKKETLVSKASNALNLNMIEKFLDSLKVTDLEEILKEDESFTARFIQKLFFVRKVKQKRKTQEESGSSVNVKLFDSSEDRLSKSKTSNLNSKKMTRWLSNSRLKRELLNQTTTDKKEDKQELFSPSSSFDPKQNKTEGGNSDSKKKKTRRFFKTSSSLKSPSIEKNK